MDKHLIVINKYKDPIDKFYMILAQCVSIGSGVDVLVVNDNPATKIIGDGFYALNHKRNLGISASRNEAIEFAILNDYKTIYFVDGDDVLTNFTTENYLRTVAILDNDQVRGVITFGYDHYATMMSGSLIQSAFTDVARSIVFRVEDIKNIRFDESLDLGEDNLFMHDFGGLDPEIIWGIGYVRYLWIPRQEGLFATRNDERRLKFEQALAKRSE